MITVCAKAFFFRSVDTRKKLCYEHTINQIFSGQVSTYFFLSFSLLNHSLTLFCLSLLFTIFHLLAERIFFLSHFFSLSKQNFHSSVPSKAFPQIYIHLKRRISCLHWWFCFLRNIHSENFQLSRLSKKCGTILMLFNTNCHFDGNIGSILQKMQNLLRN